MANSNLAKLGKPEQKTVYATLKPYVTKATQVSTHLAHQANTFLQRYPPLKAFAYSVAATSAIPVSLFAGYATSTLGGLSFIAGTTVTLIETGFLAFGAFVLSWFLLAAFVLSAIFTFWFSVVYFSYSVLKKIEGVQ